VHRGLGVHYSKVRSLTLDAWEPEILKVMAELGNTVVNQVYTARVPKNAVRATPQCDGYVKYRVLAYKIICTVNRQSKVRRLIFFNLF